MFAVRMNKEKKVLEQYFSGTEEFLKERIQRDRLGWSWTDIYGTSLEAKIDSSIQRAKYLQELLDTPYYQNVSEHSELESGNKTKQTMQGELTKTLRWLNPHIDNHPHIFL